MKNVYISANIGTSMISYIYLVLTKIIIIQIKIDILISEFRNYHLAVVGEREKEITKCMPL